MKAVWLAIMTAVAVGCGRNPAPTPQTATPAPAPAPETPKSTVSTVIDGITGKTAVEAGKRARGQIDKIGKQEQHDINEAMQP